MFDTQEIQMVESIEDETKNGCPPYSPSESSYNNIQPYPNRFMFKSFLPSTFFYLV